MRRPVLLAAPALALLLTGVSHAAASTMSVQPSQGAAGSPAAVTYSFPDCGQSPGKTVHVSFEQEEVAKGSLGAGCQAVIPIRVPASATAGPHELSAYTDDGRGGVAQGSGASTQYVVTGASPTPSASQSPTASPMTPTPEPTTASPTASPTPTGPSTDGPTLAPAAALPGSTAEEGAGAPSTGGGGHLPTIIGGSLLATAGAGVGLGVLRPRGAATPVVVSTVVGSLVAGGGLAVLPSALGSDKAGTVVATGLRVERVVQSAAIARGEEGTVTAECPTGTRPVGGGYRTDFDFRDVPGSTPLYGRADWHYQEHDLDGVSVGPRVLANNPTAKGWEVRVRNSLVDLGPISASAVVTCAAEVSDWSIEVAARETRVGRNASGVSQVTCPGATKPLAVGWTANPDVVLTGTLDGAIARLQAQTLPGASGGLRASAICGRVTGRSVVTGALAAVPGGGFATVPVACPAGKVALGGTYSVQATDEDVLQYAVAAEAAADDTGWTVRVQNHQVPFHPVTAAVVPVAICASRG